MATITLKGNTIHTVGDLPAVGTAAPKFSLVNGELADVSLADYAGKRKILNITPSLDTGVCAASAVRFNKEIVDLDDVVLLNISADLPFASSRFCQAEGLAHVVNLSCFRSPGFGRDYGVLITDGPLAGLLARAVLVLDQDNNVLHAEQVPEIAQEPDYAAALASLSR